MVKIIEIPDKASCILITKEEEGTAFQLLDNEAASSDFGTFNIAQGLCYIAVTDPDLVIAAFFRSIEEFKHNQPGGKVIDFETGKEISAPSWSTKTEGKG